MTAPLPDASHPLRLLALGDCNCIGSEHLSAGANLPDTLGRRLAQQGFPVIVCNLGLTMSTSREGLSRMREAGAADLVLINYGLVDAWMTTLPGIYIPYYPDNAIRRRSRKLLKSLKRRLRSPHLRRFIPMGEVVPLEEYQRNILDIVELARQRNPESTIILWGTAPTRHDEVRNRNLQRYNACLETLARQRGCHYLDTGKWLAELPAQDIYLDDVHLSAAGLRCLCDAMISLLAQAEPLRPGAADS